VGSYKILKSHYPRSNSALHIRNATTDELFANNRPLKRINAPTVAGDHNISVSRKCKISRPVSAKGQKIVAMRKRDALHVKT
jgi:hypothetical protein